MCTVGHRKLKVQEVTRRSGWGRPNRTAHLYAGHAKVLTLPELLLAGGSMYVPVKVE